MRSVGGVPRLCVFADTFVVDAPRVVVIVVKLSIAVSASVFLWRVLRPLLRSAGVDVFVVPLFLRPTGDSNVKQSAWRSRINSPSRLRKSSTGMSFSRTLTSTSPNEKWDVSCIYATRVAREVSVVEPTYILLHFLLL